MNVVATVFKWWAVTTAAPPFLKFMFVAVGAALSKQPDDATSRVVESWVDLVVAVVIPWWLNPLTFLASLPGMLGGLLALVFIFLLLKTGHLSPE
jgi:hypothetical protein